MAVDLGKSKVAVELLATNPFLQFETAVETLRKCVALALPPFYPPPCVNFALPAFAFCDHTSAPRPPLSLRCTAHLLLLHPLCQLSPVRFPAIGG